jgi:hypothetical protein
MAGKAHMIFPAAAVQDMPMDEALYAPQERSVTAKRWEWSI